ncbi:hypothetical protein DBV15_07437 [Temnothorax longispinosus]|uniref:Uncharacterized protein n=1 Tax=Temnothorax longispinosus TaxID=300112 RepID=A0A4S2JAR7_9HYME|nr:hypothetical protein DBV15_07437 [Temnothorax longispinosus]
MTSCPAKRPRVTNAHAECAHEAASRYIRHSRRPVKLAPPATLSESGIPFAGGDSDSSHRREIFNAFIIRGLMTPSLTHHFQRNLLRIQQPCAQKTRL